MILSGLLIGALTVPGNWVASKIVKRMGDNIHAKLIEVLIAPVVFGSWGRRFSCVGDCAIGKSGKRFARKQA